MDIDELTPTPRTKENLPPDFPDSRITNVYIFDTGMTAVFDQHRHQMPYYQGHWREVRDLILADAPKTATYHTMDRWQYDPTLKP